MAEQLLTGLKVVECGNLVSAPYLGKLLADLGAEVIKIEELSGDTARQRGPFPGDTPHSEKSGLFLYLNTNKQGVTLNLHEAKGQGVLHSLCSQADLLIHNYRPSDMASVGLDFERLQRANPGLIMTTISYFGCHGPYRDYNAYELTATNAGGWAFISPGASDYPELPPLKAFGHQADFQGGVHAAVATLGAYYHKLLTGEGQHIDVSIQECIAAILEMNFMHYTYSGNEASRLGRRSIFPWCMLDCQDGKLFVINVEEDQWQRFAELMGNPEWASLEIFEDRVQRGLNYDALFPMLQEWAANWKVADLYKAGQERRICMAPVNTMADLFASEHLKAREFFTDVSHQVAGTLQYPGAPFKVSEGGVEAPRSAPLLGEHNEAVYCGKLGLSQAELGELKQQGII
jgi:crotonobetainyl-CoA:carnitine CoA-transferase CaiB-like acyl-CoA transferase